MKREIDIHVTLSSGEKLARHLYEDEHILVDNEVWQVKDVMFRDDGAIGIDAAQYVGGTAKQYARKLFIRNREEKIATIGIYGTLKGRF